MNRHLQILRKACVGLVALVVLAALPAAANAGSIGFYNDLKVPIIVQGESTVDGTLRRGQPLQIFPRKIAWDTNLKAGVRTITIYDARQRILLRQMIPFDGTTDLSFRVVLAPVPGAGPRAAPRVQLIPLKPQP